VQFQVSDSFEYSQNCHCSDCRRATGSAFKPFAGIGIGELEIVRGQNHVHRYGNGPAFDIHCGICGSLLYSVVRDGAYAHVALGSLADAPSIRPSAHIFVGDKAPWYEITDSLPQYEGHIP
jgi:hypothetical protein